MKYFLKLSIAFLVFFPGLIIAQTSNIGLIKGIWFSDADFFTGETIRIYTAVQNNSGFDVEGTVEFFDNGSSLGQKEFSALDNRIIESWIDTTLKEGKHEFSVEIRDAQKNKLGEISSAINPQAISAESVILVKTDTDDDGIANDVDTDDGDGYSDDAEKSAGTDSLDKNKVPPVVKPTDTNPTSTNTINNTHTIEKIIEKIFVRDPESTQISPEINAQNSITSLPTESTETLVQQSPAVVQNLADENAFLKSLIIAISKVQNTGEGIIEIQQDKLAVPESKQDAINEPLKNEKNKNGDLKEDQKETQDEKQLQVHSEPIGKTFYRYLLQFFAWLFSIWWFWLIIPFIIIYLLIKLLFKIFGKKDS